MQVRNSSRYLNQKKSGSYNLKDLCAIRTIFCPHHKFSGCACAKTITQHTNQTRYSFQITYSCDHSARGAEKKTSIITLEPYCEVLCKQSLKYYSLHVLSYTIIEYDWYRGAVDIIRPFCGWFWWILKTTSSARCPEKFFSPIRGQLATNS